MEAAHIGKGYGAVELSPTALQVIYGTWTKWRLKYTMLGSQVNPPVRSFEEAEEMYGRTYWAKMCKGDERYIGSI